MFSVCQNKIAAKLFSIFALTASVFLLSGAPIKSAQAVRGNSPLSISSLANTRKKRR